MHMHFSKTVLRFTSNILFPLRRQKRMLSEQEIHQVTLSSVQIFLVPPPSAMSIAASIRFFTAFFFVKFCKSSAQLSFEGKSPASECNKTFKLTVKTKMFYNEYRKFQVVSTRFPIVQLSFFSTAWSAQAPTSLQCFQQRL